VFDAEKCAHGIDALRSYRRVWDEKLKAYRDAPLHDWASDPADAFRTFAVGKPQLRDVSHYERRRPTREWRDEAGRNAEVFGMGLDRMSAAYDAYDDPGNRTKDPPAFDLMAAIQSPNLAFDLDDSTLNAMGSKVVEEYKHRRRKPQGRGLGRAPKAAMKLAMLVAGEEEHPLAERVERQVPADRHGGDPVQRAGLSRADRRA
jgi:hypothetical protein